MLNEKIHFKDLGSIEYKEAWDFQEKLFKESLKLKSQNKEIPNHLLFCEHPHVYTIGKSGSENNLLINNIELQKRGVSFFKINRGGDITYHGPGQIVGYPIINLEAFSLGVKQYIFLIEEVIIQTLKNYGINAERLDGATGVWLDTSDKLKARKICAIGVKVSRWITMHGFAFNVNTDLNYYNYINPCGFTDKGVTSMEKELGEKVDFREVKELVKENFMRLFGGGV
ncbi:MAG: lipoyl(octanoyl) transferase LipB [Bacteroidales bacterium]|nr:lipoyl(octanoyl) transferase LipB [Bacteroidales bacterium]